MQMLKIRIFSLSQLDYVFTNPRLGLGYRRLDQIDKRRMW